MAVMVRREAVATVRVAARAETLDGASWPGDATAEELEALRQPFRCERPCRKNPWIWARRPIRDDLRTLLNEWLVGQGALNRFGKRLSVDGKCVTGWNRMCVRQTHQRRTERLQLLLDEPDCIQGILTSKTV